MSLPANMLDTDVRINARNMISYLRKIEGNTNAMYVALVKFKALFFDMKKTLIEVKERQTLQDAQHVELVHYVKKSYSMIEMMFQHITNQSPNQLNSFHPMQIEAPNLSNQVPN